MKYYHFDEIQIEQVLIFDIQKNNTRIFLGVYFAFLDGSILPASPLFVDHLY